MAVMPSPQGIGVMTVIPLTGCSVMLLVLGRQKLLELKKNCSCLQSKLNQEDGLGSHSCEHQLQQLAEGGPASITWRMSGSQSSTDKKRNLMKKVWFSEDVVEPSGDNVAYRKRHAMALKSEQRRSQKPHKSGCQNKKIDNSESKPVQSGEISRPAEWLSMLGFVTTGLSIDLISLTFGHYYSEICCFFRIRIFCIRYNIT